MLPDKSIEDWAVLCSPQQYPNRYVTTAIAARICHLSEYQLRELAKANKVKAHKRPGSKRLLFLVQDLLNFIAPPTGGQHAQ